MSTSRTQQGFTAVELLITLFVAAAFLVAGYQLFNIVIKDGGDTRAESRASNIAYDYLRRYSNTATNPCTVLSPLTNQTISVTDLSNVKVSVAITCPQADALSLSMIEAIITYGNPANTVRYATYIDKSKGATSTPDIIDGLVAQYPLNGNANALIGDTNGIVYGATPTTDKDGKANSAYAFNAANPYQYIEIPSTFGLGNTNITISLWVYQATASSYGQYIKIGGVTNGYGLGIGSTTMDSNAPGGRLVGLFEYVRWIDTSTAIGTGWHFLSMVINSSGTPLIYRDGTLVGTFTGALPIAPTGNYTRIGGHTNRYTTSSIDDVRIYNRPLSASEISQLYTLGPK